MKMMAHDSWCETQERMNTIVLNTPHKYLEEFTIGQLSSLSIRKLLRKDLFCLSKAWSPFNMVAKDDKVNITSLKITLRSYIRCNNYSEHLIYNLCDAYPIIFDEAFMPLNSKIIEKYYKRKVILDSNVLYELSLPNEIIDIIISFI